MTGVPRGRCPHCGRPFRPFEGSTTGSLWCQECGTIWSPPRRRPPGPALDGSLTGTACPDCPDTELRWHTVGRGRARCCPTCRGVLLLPGEALLLAGPAAPPPRESGLNGAVGWAFEILETIAEGLFL